MKISKVKLLKGGLDGLEIEAKEYFSSGQYQIVDTVKRKRTSPLSPELIAQVTELKYFFLNLTGHWIPVYSKFYDRENKRLIPMTTDGGKPQEYIKDLWNRTEIVSFGFNGIGFIITAKMTNVEDKPKNYTTPYITSDDDIGFFSDAILTLESLQDNIAKFLLSQKVLIQETVKNIPIEMKKNKTDEELAQMAVDILMNQGAIVLLPDDHQAIGEMSEKTTLHTNTRNIDGRSINQSNAVDDGNVEPEDSDLHKSVKGQNEDDETIEDPPRQAEKVNVFGPPASGADFPTAFNDGVPTKEVIPEDLSELEHSENIGTGEIDSVGKESEEW